MGKVQITNRGREIQNAGVQEQKGREKERTKQSNWKDLVMGN